MMTDDMTEMLNLGPKSTEWLNRIGVRTKGDLEQVGAVAAYCLIKAQNDQASLNLLYALYGALHNLRWHEISPDVKSVLLEEVSGFQFGEG